MELTISESANCAQAILRAWQSGDLPRFRWEVDAVAALVPPALDTFETERIDLLNGVAGELRGIRHPLADPNAHFCRDLLRHLAGTADIVPAGLTSTSGTAIELRSRNPSSRDT